MNMFGSNKLHCRSFMRHHRAPQSRRALPVWSDECRLASLRVAVHGRQNHPKAHQKCFFVRINLINPMVYHNFLYQNWNYKNISSVSPNFGHTHLTGNPENKMLSGFWKYHGHTFCRHVLGRWKGYIGWFDDYCIIFVVWCCPVEVAIPHWKWCPTRLCAFLHRVVANCKRDVQGRKTWTIRNIFIYVFGRPDLWLHTSTPTTCIPETNWLLRKITNKSEFTVVEGNLTEHIH